MATIAIPDNYIARVGRPMHEASVSASAAVAGPRLAATRHAAGARALAQRRQAMSARFIGARTAGDSRCEQAHVDN
jgi:hypothetical protein